MVRSEGNVSLKNPVTPQGIEPQTFRLVARRLNHYATPGPSLGMKTKLNVRTIKANQSELLMDKINVQ